MQGMAGMKWALPLSRVGIQFSWGKSNWYYGWSTYKKTYCCDKVAASRLLLVACWRIVQPIGSRESAQIRQRASDAIVSFVSHGQFVCSAVISADGRLPNLHLPTCSQSSRQRLAALEPGMASCMATAKFIWNTLVAGMEEERLQKHQRWKDWVNIRHLGHTKMIKDAHTSTVPKREPCLCVFVCCCYNIKVQVRETCLCVCELHMIHILYI